MTVTLEDLSVPPPPPGPADWNSEGVVVFPGMFDAEDVHEYQEEWLASNGNGDRFPIEDLDVDENGVLHAYRPGGWPDATPYMRHPALRALLCDQRLADALEQTVGEPMGVHLNLTGWVSTERAWHADSYLNEPEVGDHYAAVWIALGDITASSGPFQYVEGSHRWPQVTRESIGRYVDLTDPAWPSHSEKILEPLFDEEIKRRKAKVVTFLPAAGEVLMWHGRLLHRGSRPERPGAYRPALIAHYSGIHRRPRMPKAVQHERGGWYFPIQGETSLGR